MKKTLAILLALTLVFSSITVSFAEETLTPAGQAAKDLGMLVGDANGVTQQYLNTAPTRIQAAVMILRLKGLLADAEKFTGTDNFADAEKAAWAKPIMAYLKANPSVGYAGVGNNSFNPTATIDAKSYYVVMLQALGYKSGTDFTWDNAMTVAAAKGLKAVAGVTNFTVNDLATATIETLKTNVAGGTTTLAAKLIADKVITQEAAAKAGVVVVADLAVTSVKASTAKSFVVKFNKAVADADKVTVAVTRGTTAVTTTTTWSTDKTEATVATASNLAEATFTVVVKADAKELAKQDITITAQKVAKIEFTSKSVAVNLAAPNSTTGGNGYVTYKVYDQYNNDITNHYLANNLTFNVGVGQASWKDGVLTITPNANTTLMQYQAISVIGYDTTSGVSATVSLPTATAVGTLSDFVLGSVENLKLVDGDVTSVYYIPFTAKDMSGNETKDYNVIKNGLILQAGDELVVSMNGYVSVALVQDPADSRKAAIQVKAKTNPVALSMDMPVTVTAMTLTGKTSSVSTTIAKAKSVHSITLLAPSATVAINEKPEIGFEAYDQHGNRVTRFSEIDGYVTENGFNIVEKVDGTAKFEMTPIATKGMVTLSTVVSKTGKMSTLNINVQDYARPARLAIDSAAVDAAMEVGATQLIGLVDGDAGEITIYDQYDREMSADDIDTAFTTGVNGKVYGVIATQTTAHVDINYTSLATAASDVTVTADAASTLGGHGTVQFSLIDKANPAVALSSVTASIAVIKTADIVDYTINPITSAIYTSNEANDNNPATVADATYTDREKAYAANPKVYGKTNSGAKVLLAGSPVVGASVDNGTDFTVTTAAGAYNAVKVTANKFSDPAKTGSTTKVTLNLVHNGKVSAVTTEIKSSTVAPYSVDVITDGEITDDVATIGFANVGSIDDRYVVEFDSADTKTTSSNNTAAYFRFRNKDQYGKYAQKFNNFYITKFHDGSAYVTTPSNVTISADGLLDVSGVTAGDSFVITGVTKNGLVKSVKLQF